MKTDPVPLFPSPEPADVPWLDVLREATGYNLSTEQEAKLIETVDSLGLAENTLMMTANTLASQWPYKKHKRIDLTYVAWLRREFYRPPQRPRDVAPEVMQDYLARKRATAAYLKAHPEQDQRQA